MEFKSFKEYLNDNNPQVLIDMGEYGKMELELFPSTAEITVDNFLKLVDKKFYDGIIFHRVIEGFMIQGGDPKGIGIGGSDETIKGEFIINGVNNLLKHTRGVISMARTNMPNSASSQFFIMHKDSPHLDGSYAAFGVVTKGIEVVDKIAVVETDHRNKPLKDVTIKSIRRIR
ncbi:MAG: peptidylprolyl isomerase [Acholeplasmatales bacterium]|nr:peptidylprolyl isomerase [Acholeplasmatales bacterium]